MNTLVKTFLATAALGLVAILPSARAQLMLTGSTHGVFTDPGLPHTTVTNGSPDSLFSSGVPYRITDTQTSVAFSGSDFTDATSGDTITLGNADVTNGITRLGTTAGFADLSLYLDLPGQGISNYHFSTLHFTIDNTSNNGMHNVPDLFKVTNTPSAPLVIGHTTVTFDVGLSNPAFSSDGGASVSEGSSANFDVFATISSFTPVPEASTYALWGAALLVGVIALRRFRSTERNATT